MSNDNSIVRSMKITCPHCGAAIIHLYEDDHDAIDALQRENAALKAEVMLWKSRAESYDGQIDDRDMEINKLKATVERCRELAYKWNRKSQSLSYYARYARQLVAAIDGRKDSGDE